MDAPDCIGALKMKRLTEKQIWSVLSLWVENKSISHLARKFGITEASMAVRIKHYLDSRAQTTLNYCPFSIGPDGALYDYAIQSRNTKEAKMKSKLILSKLANILFLMGYTGKINGDSLHWTPGGNWHVLFLTGENDERAWHVQCQECSDRLTQVQLYEISGGDINKLISDGAQKR